MNQRGAVEKLDRARSSGGEGAIAAVIRQCYCHAKLWPHSGAPGEHGILHRLCQQGWTLSRGVLLEIASNVLLAI